MHSHTTGGTHALPQRRVHLDYHTSPLILDAGCEFDADEFADTMRSASVQSVTVFAKCHHGMCYYPTTVGTQHPALVRQGRRDLLGEQIEALHRAGIRCPLYTTVAWEEDVAQRYPEWRQVRSDGAFARVERSTDERTIQAGNWWFINFLHPGYQDYIEAHITEVLDRYGDAVDGFFFDIVFFERHSCWSESSVRFREEHGLMNEDPATHVLFEGAAQAQFAERFTRLITARRPDATLFYNSSMHSYIAPEGARLGIRARQPFQTHTELESLPSGFWGYQHFPRMARQVSQWKTPWLGMTGRFQKQWGDFGGIKPQAALEYECFRSQALGGGNSVGDQLPPRGTLDPAAYALIGAVYAQCEAAEPFYAGSESLPQIGILLPHYPGLDRDACDKSLEGVVQMCEETHYECAVLDDASDLEGFALVILPDSTVVTPGLHRKLRAYYESGGRLMFSHRAGFDASGQWALDFLPVQPEGEVEKWPTFWRASPDFAPELSRSDRVFYERGMNLRGGPHTHTLVDRVLPYFKRTDAHFCSHFQTPPLAEADRFPAVIAGERFVAFADPAFREYRQAGNTPVRDVWARAMECLAGPPPFGAGLPTTVLSVPRRRGGDLLLTLLHYVPVRKALDIDVIEERMGFAGYALRIPSASARLWDTGEPLPLAGKGVFTLPVRSGRLLVEVPGFFTG